MAKSKKPSLPSKWKGAAISALGNVPIKGVIKKGAKALKKASKAAKKKVSNTKKKVVASLKTQKKTVKKKIGKIVKKRGKVFTKARKLKNNLTKKEQISNQKKLMNKQVLAAKVNVRYAKGNVYSKLSNPPMCPNPNQYTEEKIYQMYINGNNEIMFQISKEKREAVLDRLKRETVQKEIENKFPTVRAGFDFGTTFIPAPKTRTIGRILGLTSKSKKPSNVSKSNVSKNIFGMDASKPLKASDLRQYAKSQGWTKSQTANGPEKWVDKNGVARITIKKGSDRAPGSANPHVEIKDAKGQRIDSLGNPVNRKSPDNHTPIIFD
ncbi:MAG TPA: hypothetical protein GX497_03735 [Bacillus bacterium]|nr:hypothetical protein [Bacillus sp. (in: firmicutes)]